MRRITGALVALGLLLGGCAAPPSPDSAPRTVAARSMSDQRIGDENHPKILAEFGGAYTAGRAGGYVAEIGRRLVAESEQPGAKWTFTVLDSPVVNAFALPGGYVYVTRGLIALANDEAELAGVIGHEMGHVTAAHSARRQSTAAVAQAGVLAAVIGAAILGADRSVIDAVGQGGSALAQGTVASYSRAQELEADRLGIAYLAAAGYDPLAQADFLRSMQAQDDLSARLRGGGYDPNRVDFFSTHPATAERVRAATEAAARQQAQGDGRRERAAFERAVSGMTYGDSAAQGFVRGNRFIHPELRFAFEAPDGFTITNAAAQVAARGPNGASMVFDGGRDPGGALEAHVRDWAAGIARQTRAGPLQNLRRERIGGAEAARAALPIQTRAGPRLALLTVIRAPGDRLYRFFGVAQPGDRAGLAGLERSAASFRTLTAAQAARERPWRIEFVTVRQGDTVERLAARMPFDRANAERFRVLNGLGPRDQVRPGQRVKLVAG